MSFKKRRVKAKASSYTQCCTQSFIALFFSFLAHCVSTENKKHPFKSMELKYFDDEEIDMIKHAKRLLMKRKAGGVIENNSKRRRKS